VAASVLVILAIVTGLIVTLHEARIARVQSARAERRFNDVRKLANSLMFEVHDSIRDLPGAMPARKLLVNRAQEYLDSLSQEASGDAGLQRELAAAYDRIGDLLGYNGGANLGDYSGAMRSYEKALATREASAAANPDDLQMQLDLLSDYFRLSFTCQDMGDYPAALRHLDKGTALAQRLTSRHPEVVFKDFQAGLFWQTGNVLMASGQYQRALENYRQGASIREVIAQDPKTTPLIQVHLVADYIGLGKALRATGDLNHAVEYFRKGIEMMERQAQADSNNGTLQEYLGEAESQAASTLFKRGDLAEANKYYGKSLEVFSRLSSADPSNALARVNAGLVQVAMADVLIEEGQIDPAMAQIRSGIAAFEGIEHKNRYEILGQASSYEALGRAHHALAGKNISATRKLEHLREARLWYTKSQSTLHQATGLGSVNPLGGNITPDSVAGELNRCDEALARLNRH
jgi:tetratricopeptide (TPR) repeat protein